MSGLPPASACKKIVIKFIYLEITSEVILITFLLGFVFAVRVTALFCFPLLPELLKVTSIVPDSPGAIGSFGQLGTVQPQDPLALEIIRGALPEFVNLKE